MRSRGCRLDLHLYKSSLSAIRDFLVPEGCKHLAVNNPAFVQEIVARFLLS